MSLFQIKENIVSLYLNPLMFRSHGYIREMLLLDVLMKEKPKDNISGLACHVKTVQSDTSQEFILI